MDAEKNGEVVGKTGGRRLVCLNVNEGSDGSAQLSGGNGETDCRSRRVPHLSAAPQWAGTVGIDGKENGVRSCDRTP